MNQREAAVAWSNAIYERWVMQAVFSAYIKMPLHVEIEMLVGHNPQRLLTDQRSAWTRLWVDNVADYIDFDVINKMGVVVQRWNEPDADPLADIEAALAHLGATCCGKTDATAKHIGVLLDNGFDVFGHTTDSFMKMVYDFSRANAKTEVLPKRPDYHRHDPTKQHGTHKHTKRYTKRKGSKR